MLNWRQYLHLAIPVMAQSLLVTLLGICDTVMISSVSEAAISGVSVANRTFFIFNLTVFGLTNGVGIFLAQYFGAKDKEGFSRIFQFGLLASSFIALVFMLVLWLVPEWTIELFVKNPKVIAYGLDYVRVVRYSFLPVALTMMCGVACKVRGKANIPMLTGGVAFVVNFGLNWLLIPTMEAQGAALATLAARFAESAFLMVVVLKDLGLSTKRWMPAGHEMAIIIRKTIPLVINEILWSSSISFVFLNFCFVAEKYIPSFTVLDNVASVVFVVFSGASTAAGVLTGQLLGQGHFEQAKQQSKQMIGIGFVISGSFSLLVFLLAPYIPSWFNLTGDVAAMTTLLLRIRSGISWTQGLAETVYYILRAGGDAKGVLIIDGLFMLLGPMLVSTLGARLFHLNIVWLFFAAEAVYFVKVFLSLSMYKRGKWLNNLVEAS